MTEGSFNNKLLAQVFVDGLRLCGRFDDDDFHQSALWRKVAPAGQLKWVRNQSVANIQRKGNEVAGVAFDPAGEFQLE